MEIFLDGGLFEIAIGVGVAYVLNFIFLRKYLLYFYCSLAVGSAVVLLFVHNGPLYYTCVTVNILNMLLLVIMLLKQRVHKPNEGLFNIEAIKKRFSR